MPAQEYKWCSQCGTPFTKHPKFSVSQWASQRFHDAKCAAMWNAAQRITHGATINDGTRPEYESWRAMKSRCLNPNATGYPQYGGRGVTICEAWRYDFAAFLADMGPRPVGTSLDRIDPDGDYEPGNCRWATAKEQANNRRCTGHVRICMVEGCGTKMLALGLCSAHYQRQRKKEQATQ
jgi:hypothetical protein